MASKQGKFCRKHGSRYLPPDERSSLCLHHDCVESIIQTICSRSRRLDKIWKLITDKGLRDSAVSWVLTTLFEKHRRDPAYLMILTRQFVYFALLNFVNQTMHKELPLAESFRLKKRDIKIQALEDEASAFIQEQLADLAAPFPAAAHTIRQFAANSPFNVTFRNQIYDLISEQWGPEWVAYLMDQVTMADMMRLTGMKMSEIRETRQEIVEYFHTWWQDFD